MDVEVDGRRSTVRVTHAGDHLHIQSRRGTVDFRIVPRFVAPGTQVPSGGLAAPMPGTVVEVRVAPGERVTAGTTLVVMEAMKMEHHINAPAGGIVVEVFVGPGQQVDNGVALLVIEPEGAGPDEPGSQPGQGAGEGPR
jgi:propionyl-CoA carboxylase alpha chain